MKKNGEVELIKKQNKKLKVICLLLGIIVFLGVAGAGTLRY